MSFWDEWFKRFGRRDSFFGEFDRMMRDMEKEMTDMIRDMEKNMPDEMSHEVKAPDGSTRREYGPFVYGYSVKIGPEGKPVIREFGNIKPGLGDNEASMSLQGKREPLVDVLEDESSIKILAELPGVEKEEIKLYAKSNGLTITVDNMDRRYYKELEFDTEIDRKTAKSSYRNGVLEVSFSKKSRDEESTPIKVE